MSFIDKVGVVLKAGDGGDGIVAWLREAHMEFGGPSGGDGGRGGSVLLIGDANVNTLFHLRHVKAVVADAGTNGGIKNMTGRSGKDVEVRVPLGTAVTDAKTGKLLTDITVHGQTVRICEGGKGGRGNASFLSGRNKAPRFFERGDKGEEKEVVMELKIMADVGIYGAPNAGKSTLLSKISAATPKIAGYKFTTLVPVLGTVGLSGGRSMVVADIPGLIEGAAQGHGLGHEFLRHIERCKVLLHLTSMDPIDNPDPLLTWKQVNAELKAHGHGLEKKPVINVATKMDTDGASANFTKFNKGTGGKAIAISALVSENLPAVLEAAWKLVAANREAAPEVEASMDPQTFKTYGFEGTPQKGEGLVVQKIGEGKWKATSPRLSYWAHKIPLTTPDNITRFNDKAISEGIFERMKELGAVPGDTIEVGEQELDYHGREVKQ